MVATTSVVTVEWLGTLNPKCAQYPLGFSEEHEAVSLGRVALVAKQLREFTGANHPVEVVQDATFFAAVMLQVVGLRGMGPIPIIRFSRFASLCTVTMEHRLPPSTLHGVQGVLSGHGFCYVDETLLGEKFNVRRRFCGDLFNQLFDYV